MFRCSAFSLTEVMFAVIVLGIGFILVAALFPVAISQSRMTVEDTAAAGMARSAMALSSRVADGSDLSPVTPAPADWGPAFPVTGLYESPPTSNLAGMKDTTVIPVNPGQQVVVPGKVLALNDARLDDGAHPGPVNYQANLWNAIRGSLVTPSDNRFAWVALYRRDCSYYNPTGGTLNVPANGLVRLDAPFATVYFIPVAVRNRSAYEDADINNGILSNLRPKAVYVVIQQNTAAISGYVAQFQRAGTTPDAVDSVAEGTYLVISDDAIATPVALKGRMNGRIFRMGNRRPDLDSDANHNAFELAPGSEFVADGGADGIVKKYESDSFPKDDIVGIGTPAAGGTASVLLPKSNADSTATATPMTPTFSGPAVGLIVGRNLNPAGNAYEGPAQDVGAYVTFVKVN